MQKFNIRLNVAGKSYALGIEREKEEIFRRAEQEDVYKSQRVLRAI